MKIQVCRCSRIAHAEVKSMAADYRTRIQVFCKAEDRELKLEVKGRDKRSIDKSTEPIYKKSNGEFLVVLDERGPTWTTSDFAKKIQCWTDDPKIKQLVFLIGPPYGFDAISKKEADAIWSLSPLTVPSDLAYLLVWEQLYRAQTILKKLPYHHD